MYELPLPGIRRYGGIVIASQEWCDETMVIMVLVSNEPYYRLMEIEYETGRIVTDTAFVNIADAVAEYV